MQTTLLGIAIAIILALVTALVGPLFIDWNRYRGPFEAEASRLTGLQVRIAGPIEARLLPTPTMTLQRVDISRPGEAGAVRAHKLGIEFALGALVRGEWRATDVRVEGAEFALGLDGSGRIDWPAPAVGFDPDTISIQSLDIVDSRAILADGTSGSGLILEHLEFRGELRSLAGPLKGEGSFYYDGQHYPYRLAASRVGDDGATRIRLNIDPIDRPLIADADGLVSIERGVPHFEGTLQLARPVVRAPKGAQALIVEPWRITTKIKGDSRAAVLEQIEFQYGPDDRAIKLKGDAKVSFGRQPQLNGVLSSTQIDLDRILALPEPARRHPLSAVKSFTDYLTGAQHMPMPLKIGISVEQVTLAGATLQKLTGDVKSDAEGWDLESLDFRAPGAAQVRLSGRLTVSPKGIAFAGPAKVEALDSRALVAWLTDRAETQSAAGAFRLEGDVKLASDMIAVDRLKAELDRMTLEGRFAYSWASGAHPPRIEAALSAPEIDLDRAQALAAGMFAGTAFDWPREGKLALKIGRASLAGIEAKSADVNVQFDGRGLDIEHLVLGDFGGAALTVKGRIDSHTQIPRGAVTLDLDARALDGVAAAVERFAPAAAGELRRNAARLIPAKLRATLTVNSPPNAAIAPAVAAFRVEGRAGTFEIALQGNGGTVSDAFTIAHFGKLAAARLNATGRIDAGEGGALIEMLGLDKLVAVDKRPGRLNLTVGGPLDNDMAISGQLVAGGLDVSAKGKVRLSGGDGPTAGLDIAVANANVRTPRPAAAGRPPETLPAAFSAKLSFAEETIALSDLTGKVGGADIGGRLKIGVAQPTVVEGDVEIGTVNLPGAIATAIGVPQQTASADAAWPSEPFEVGILGSLSGQLAVKAARVALTPKLAAQDLRGVLRFDRSEISLEDIEGTLAGGRVTGSLNLERGPDGLNAASRVRLAGVNIGELLPTEGEPALSGHLTADLNLEGTGRSAIALVGSLKGGGTFTLQDGRVARIDPQAFDTIIRNVDQGLPIDVNRIRDRMEVALANGGLAIPLAEGEIALAAGQARLVNTVVRAEHVDLALVANVDLAQSIIDASMTLTGAAGAGGASQGRPEVGIVVKGPIRAPKRTLEVAALTNWLSLRRIEQQTKKIDELEQSRELPAAPPVPADPQPGASPPAEAAPAVRPHATRDTPSAPTSTLQRRATTPARSAAPASSQGPSLAPPIDIRPQTTPRRPRLQSGADSSTGAPRPPAPIAAPTSRGSPMLEN